MCCVERCSRFAAVSSTGNRGAGWSLSHIGATPASAVPHWGARQRPPLEVGGRAQRQVVPRDRRIRRPVPVAPAIRLPANRAPLIIRIRQ